MNYSVLNRPKSGFKKIVRTQNMVSVLNVNSHNYCFNKHSSNKILFYQVLFLMDAFRYFSFPHPELYWKGRAKLERLGTKTDANHTCDGLKI